MHVVVIRRKVEPASFNKPVGNIFSCVERISKIFEQFLMCGHFGQSPSLLAQLGSTTRNGMVLTVNLSFLESNTRIHEKSRYTSFLLLHFWE